jgi:putative hydrolase of the HAD superfamily
MWQHVEEENHEARNHRVRPLEGRLARIFELSEGERSDDLMMALCRRFMIPVFAWGRLYEDTLPTLDALRAKGYRTAILSNTPWGSPAELWREEVTRFGLGERVHVVVFCGDVGWRKPAKPIFGFAMDKLHVLPRQCLFVGDDPRWDLVGPRAVGIDALLIDRQGSAEGTAEESIQDLHQLWERL